MLSAKVAIKNAEKAKKELAEKGLIDSRYFMKKEGEFFYIPILKKTNGFDIVEAEFEKRKIRGNFDEEIRKKLSVNELKHFNGAFDVIGDIAIIEIDRELEDKEKIIAETLLATNPKIKTVVKKSGEHKGEYRLQDYKHLAGADNFETIHKENGVILKLDIRKTYYSLRSSGERLRISSLVKNGEKILVMFSGIGIYAFVFAKHSPASKIVAVEINPDACFYANESLKLNRIKNVELNCSDVREFFKNKNVKYERIVMPLPKSASDFLDVARNLSAKGTVIHFYFFDTSELLNDYSKIEEIFSKYFEKFRVLRIVKAGQQSPRVFRLCADVQVL